MHISTNDLHYCKPARLLQWAPSGGRPRRCLSATAPPRRAPPHQQRQSVTTLEDRWPLSSKRPPPQPLLSKDATAHSHQPGDRPDPPHPSPARSGSRRPAKPQGQVPITEQNFSLLTLACDFCVCIYVYIYIRMYTSSSSRTLTTSLPNTSNPCTRTQATARWSCL